MTAARGRAAGIEAGLQETSTGAASAERALAERADRHDALSRRVYEARSARERLGLRAEQAGAAAESAGPPDRAGARPSSGAVGDRRRA